VGKYRGKRDQTRRRNKKTCLAVEVREADGACANLRCCYLFIYFVSPSLEKKRECCFEPSLPSAKRECPSSPFLGKLDKTVIMYSLYGPGVQLTVMYIGADWAPLTVSVSYFNGDLTLAVSVRDGNGPGKTLILWSGLFIKIAYLSCLVHTFGSESFGPSCLRAKFFWPGSARPDPLCGVVFLKSVQKCIFWAF
jgi:hypothetical protein